MSLEQVTEQVVATLKRSAHLSATNLVDLFILLQTPHPFSHLAAPGFCASCVTACAQTTLLAPQLLLLLRLPAASSCLPLAACCLLPVACRPARLLRGSSRCWCRWQRRRRRWCTCTAPGRLQKGPRRSESAIVRTPLTRALPDRACAGERGRCSKGGRNSNRRGSEEHGALRPFSAPAAAAHYSMRVLGTWGPEDRDRGEEVDLGLDRRVIAKSKNGQGGVLRARGRCAYQGGSDLSTAHR